MIMKILIRQPVAYAKGCVVLERIEWELGGNWIVATITEEVATIRLKVAITRKVATILPIVATIPPDVTSKPQISKQSL